MILLALLQPTSALLSSILNLASLIQLQNQKPKIAINFSFPQLTLIGSDLFWQFKIKSALPILDNN